MSIARRLLTIQGGQLRPFKFTIQTTSGNTQFELPITAPGGKQPNLTVSWGDGSGDSTIISPLLLLKLIHLLHLVLTKF